MVAPSPKAIIPPAEHLQQLKFYKDQIMELILNKKWNQGCSFTHKVTLLNVDFQLWQWGFEKKVSNAHFAEIQPFIFCIKWP